MEPNIGANNGKAVSISNDDVCDYSLHLQQQQQHLQQQHQQQQHQQQQQQQQQHYMHNLYESELRNEQIHSATANILNTVDIVPSAQTQQQQGQQHAVNLLHELDALKKSYAILVEKVAILSEENAALKSKNSASVITAENAPRKMARKTTKKKNINNNINNETSVAHDDFNVCNEAGFNEMDCSNTDGVTEGVTNTGYQDEAPFQTVSNFKNTNNSHNYNSTNIDNNTSSKNKKKIMQVSGINIQNLKNKIKKNNCNNFTLKQNNSASPVKIVIDKPEDITKIRDTLVSNKISFHEYKWNDEKNKCFLIRGLSGATVEDIPTIKQDLINAGLPNSIVISPLITGFMRANPQARHNSLFKLIAPPDFDNNILLNIKYLDHIAVSFENFKTKSVIQCKNCQRYGHSAGGCGHEHRCVKCGLNHLRDACPRTLNKSIKLKCCNCDGEHTANNLSVCKYFASYTNNSNKNKPSIPVINTTNNKVTSTPANPVSRSPNITHSISSPNINSPTRNLSYSQVVENSSTNEIINSKLLNDLAKKIDLIMNLVLKHENLFSKLLDG